MRFGPVPLAEAEGAILAHSVRLDARRIAKGTLLGPDDIAALEEDGQAEVVVARLEPGDVPENEAAERLAAALVPAPEAACLRRAAPQAGRVNLHAAGLGLLQVDVDRVHALNRLDPAVTFATLAPFSVVQPDMLVGTVKIITYAVAGETLARAAAVAAGAVRVREPQLKSAGLVLSLVGDDSDRLADKAVRAVADRLAALGAALTDQRRVPHETDAIAEALGSIGGEIALVLTGAATCDPHDTAPEAVRRAGGTVTRFGMPVDPGNLLFYGRLTGRPVIGLPGCARSPALNGADWVLERIVCGIEPDGDDIAAMGVGGLLKESPARPQPREGRGPQLSARR